MNLKDIIQQPEGRRLEFKETIPSASDLTKTIVAFSNDAGGELYLGIKDEPREIVGIPENNLLKMEEMISNLIFNNCKPIIIPEISILNFDDKYLLKIKINRGNNLPYFLKSKGKKEGTYIRVGSSNRLANEEIIEELERQKRNISFDAELVYDKDIEEIYFDDFAKLYHEKTGEKLDDSTLKKLHLIVPFQGNMKATKALMLFSDDNLKSSMFPYAKVECARFKGVSTEEFIDQKTLDGNIAKQAELSYEFVLRHINKGAKVKGIYTENRWEYPIKAIREVIRNAIVHRDYALSGKDIKLAIYDDMIEITSPGLLLPSIDFADMQTRQSDIRNKVIAPVFKKLGLIDQWGNGLKLIADELRDYPEIELKWFEKGLQFQVQFIKKTPLKTIDKLESIPEIATKLRLSYDQVTTMLRLCLKPQSRKHILEAIGYSNHTDNYKKYLEPLIKELLIEMTMPNTPKSPKQQYITTKKGELLINE